MRYLDILIDVNEGYEATALDGRKIVIWKNPSPEILIQKLRRVKFLRGVISGNDVFWSSSSSLIHVQISKAIGEPNSYDTGSVTLNITSSGAIRFDFIKRWGSDISKKLPKSIVQLLSNPEVFIYRGNDFIAGSEWLKQNLTEAPLADFDIAGDTSTAGSFRDQDLRAMQNPKWQAKVYKAFSKTPYDFNIYLYNAPEGIANVGKQRYPNSPKNFPVQVNDLNKLSDYVGIREISLISQIVGKPIPNYESSITALLVENEGAERVSLTPWILAHRIVHALLLGFPDIEKDMIGLFNSFMFEMEQMLIRSTAYSEKMRQLISNIDRVNYIAQALAKFKSGKMGKLANSGEFLVESITQYLVTGEVSYNRIDVDANGRSKPITDPLLKIARDIKNSSTEPREDFIKFVLKKEFTRIPKREPRVHYIGYDSDGNAAVSIPDYHNTQERIKLYQDQEGYTFKKIVPTKAAVQKYAAYKAREKELNDLWVGYRYDGLLGIHATWTDISDKKIETFETQLTKLIVKMLDSCVGKAIVL